MLSKWIKVAQLCVDQGNFSDAMEIATSICGHLIERLGWSSKLKSHELKQVEKLRELISPFDNYTVYRTMYKQTPVGRRIPFIPVLVRDIISLEESMSMLESFEAKFAICDKIAVTVDILNQVKSMPTSEIPVDESLIISILDARNQTLAYDDLKKISDAMRKKPS